MALPFLKHETEEDATQAIAFAAIIAITIGLAVFNVIGVILGSEGRSLLQVIARGAAGLFLVGAEFLAAVALVRVMLAKNRLRKLIGTVIFLGLAWACIQNGKRTAHEIFPEFEQSAQLLEQRSLIAKGQADIENTAVQSAIDQRPEDLRRIRERIAKLEGEQQLMASQSPEKIEEAQAALIAQGKYFWEVDGVRGPETERAMRARGEEIRIELDNLRRQETNLASGAIQVPTATDEDSAALEAATLADKARQARNAAIWIEVMLWVLEGARSFGLWALVTTITAKEEDEESEATKKAKLNGKLGNDAKKTKAEGRERSKILIPPKVKAMG